ncbi:MAG: hypothetical protein KF770_18720 [Anaerolineae bacterium]|nr:hypothetical protein [Anaerolineae bacterium]
MKKLITATTISIISLASGWLWFATLFAQPGVSSNSEVIYDASTGLFPEEVCPKWTLIDRATPEDPTLSGDKLVISTSANSEQIFYIQYDLAISYPLMIEARVKRVSGSTSSTLREPIAIGFTIKPDEGNALGNTLYIGNDVVFLLAPSGRGDVASVDTDDEFHNYRLEVDATGAVQVYYDDVLELTGAAYSNVGTHGLVERIYWGQFSILANGASEWELVKHNAGCGSYIYLPTILK